MEKKKGEDEVYGCTCVVQNKQETKKRKKKRKHMDERIEILPQYFYNKF